MKVWVDAQLSPAMARYLKDELGTDASALRDIGLRDAEDGEIGKRQDSCRMSLHAA